MNASDEVYLQTEKALGICWNIEKDRFGFKPNLGETLFARRRMLSMVSRICDPLSFAAPFLLKGKMILQVLCKSNYS